MTNNNQLKVSCLKFNGHKIELSENRKGLPVAKYSRLLTAGINKGTFKVIEGYYFSTEERRKEWVTKKIADLKERVSEKEGRKNMKKEARENMVNPFKVGEIYYDSWGYDQTNIDFYQVVEVKAKSVVIREIGGEMVEGTAGHDSCNVKPCKDNFVSAPYTKPVVISLNSKNEPVFHIKSRHGWISLYDRKENGVYSSWGH